MRQTIHHEPTSVNVPIL